ncbi:hypothetical protein GMOD_00008138 [Pyrenophora seminiperda CCB06]|uniref:Uncharacterized protein n=1 Tax=Pyrenophora seminiperda CCB06 TaxID=1302712 RepID=A0A3M7M1U2_9PLEO|nr:hypothetical protein GMOD_00008138 [Pyrenophora seminiperda CCB06]
MSDQTTLTLPAFSSPGDLKEFNAETAKFWSDKCISYWMTGEITADPNVVSGRTPLQQFFNGTVTAYDQSQQPTAITWDAFPKLVCHRVLSITTLPGLTLYKVTSAFKNVPLRWQVADSQRMFQDEYLEWSVQRDSKTQQIKSVTYTCEGPEVSQPHQVENDV